MEALISNQNVDIVRRGFEHFIATGEPPWETLDEDVVVSDHDILDAANYRGYAGLARWAGGLECSLGRLALGAR